MLRLCLYFIKWAKLELPNFYFMNLAWASNCCIFLAVSNWKSCQISLLIWMLDMVFFLSYLKYYLCNFFICFCSSRYVNKHLIMLRSLKAKHCSLTGGSYLYKCAVRKSSRDLSIMWNVGIYVIHKRFWLFEWLNFRFLWLGLSSIEAWQSHWRTSSKNIWKAWEKWKHCILQQLFD